jgi:hypothetical protein
MSDAALKTQTAAREIESRVASLDWQQIVNDLDVYGCAVAPALLLPDECRGLSARYGQDEPFRSRIVMARHGFGRGEYKYWASPLCSTISGVRLQ